MGFFSDLGKGMANVATAGISGAISSGLNGLSSVVSDKRSYKYTRKLMDYQNQLQNANIDKQNAFNLEQWNRQNEYNSPSSIASRLREGGFNPALLSSQGQLSVPSGQLSGAQSESVSPSQFSTNNPMLGSSFMSGMMQSAQMDLMVKQMEGQSLDNISKGIDIDIKSGQAPYLKKQVEEEVRNMIWHNKLGEGTYQNLITQSQIQTKSMQLDNQIKQMNLSQQDKRFAYEIKETIARTMVLYSQNKLNVAEAKKAIIDAACNIRNTNINQQNADTNRMNADTNAFNAQTNRMVGASVARKNNADASYQEMYNGSVAHQGAFWETKKGQEKLSEYLQNVISDNTIEQIKVSGSISATQQLIHDLNTFNPMNSEQEVTTSRKGWKFPGKR